MKRDDPIAQLRALDPAGEKELDDLVARFAGVDQLLTRSTVGWRTRPRMALVAVAGVAAAVVLGALAANPFSRSGTISSAQAKAQAARALNLEGAWHVRRILQFSGEGSGPTSPHWSKPLSEDVWHAPDGRLVITSTDSSGDSSTWLYAGGERRAYDTHSRTLTIHRFVLSADLRDEMRTYLPQSAADLYRAAYRVGKVRLAGIETIAGRRVYRLAFEWLGSSYTLIFDADRKVPISSESRTPNGPASRAPSSARRYFFTRVRYAAYQRVQPGPDLDRRLVLPAIPSDAVTVREHPIVVPQPVRGASAKQLANGILARYKGVFGPQAVPARASYAIVRSIPGGGIAVLARVPSRAAIRSCSAVAEIAHPGGEARVTFAGCNGRGGGYFSSRSRNGKAVIVAGSLPRARALDFEFADGEVVHAELRDGRFLETPALKLFQKPFTLVITNRDGTVTRTPWPLRPLFGDFVTHLAG